MQEAVADHHFTVRDNQRLYSPQLKSEAKVPMPKAIHVVAAEILAESNRPMTADEIYEIIAAKNLYTFKAASPRSVLRSQLRRHSANITGPNQAKDLKFQMSSDGQFMLN